MRLVRNGNSYMARKSLNLIKTLKMPTSAQALLLIPLSCVCVGLRAPPANYSQAWLKIINLPLKKSLVFSNAALGFKFFHISFGGSQQLQRLQVQ